MFNKSAFIANVLANEKRTLGQIWMEPEMSVHLMPDLTLPTHPDKPGWNQKCPFT
jgi:hypothetical protein